MPVTMKFFLLGISLYIAPIQNLRYSHFRFCYTEDLEVTLKLALPTLYAAKKYIIPLLENKSRDTLMENLSSQNIWETYTASLSYTDNALHKACEEYFTDSVTKVVSALKSPDFLSTHPETLLDLLQINNRKKYKCGIVAADTELFKACDRWSDAECLRLEVEPSGENKRMVLGDGLFHIHFPDILPADIASIVSPSGFLTREELIDLLELANGADRIITGFHSKPVSFVVVIGDARDNHDQRGNSQINGAPVSYSSIVIEPHDRLLLSGIWLTMSSVNAEYEVVVTKRTCLDKGKVLNISCSSIEAGSIIDGKETKYGYLPLEKNQLLDIGFQYVIKVARLGSLALLCTKHTDIPIAFKVCEQLNFDVKGNANKIIMALTLLLV